MEPYSSTAQVQFDEPEATGGVPILKYKAEWKSLGEEAWHFKWYDAKEGESGTHPRIHQILVDRVPGVTICHPIQLPVEIGTLQLESGQGHASIELLAFCPLLLQDLVLVTSPGQEGHLQ